MSTKAETAHRQLFGKLWSVKNDDRSVSNGWRVQVESVAMIEIKVDGGFANTERVVQAETTVTLQVRQSTGIQ